MKLAFEGSTVSYFYIAQMEKDVKGEQEMLEYSIYMREYGDSYRSIYNYLNANSTDEAMNDRIVRELSKLEKEGKLKSKKKKTMSSTSIVMGTLLLCLGVFSLFFLWNKGIIASVSFVMIGAGLLGLTGAMG